MISEFAPKRQAILRRLIEENLLAIKEDTIRENAIFSVKKSLANKNVGDFLSLCIDLSFPTNMYYLFMRVNGFKSNTDYNGELSLLSPSMTLYKKLVNQVKTMKV